MVCTECSVIGSWLTLVFVDVINITSIIVFGVEHQADDGFTYGSSYWVIGKFVATLEGLA